MEEKPAFYIREFLNKEQYHSSAHIIFKVPRLDSRKSDCHPDYAEMIIADCTRSVNIDLCWFDQESFDNSLYKLDILVDNLIEFRKEFRKQGERAMTIAKKREKRKSNGQSDW